MDSQWTSVVCVGFTFLGLTLHLHGAFLYARVCPPPQFPSVVERKKASNF